MQTTIKRIRKFDGDLLTELFQRAGEKEIDPTPEFFEDANDILLVSYTGGSPSGFSYAYVLRGLRSPHPKMFLYSIDVFAEFRRRGIATMLIEALKDIARTNRCREMFVPTAKSNVAAVGLCRKTGGKIENHGDVTFIYGRETFK